MTEVNADYSKLTVPQLKARCKELKIAGYSKLGKAALLERLNQHEKPITGPHNTIGPVTVEKATGSSLDSQHDSRSVLQAQISCHVDPLPYSIHGLDICASAKNAKPALPISVTSPSSANKGRNSATDVSRRAGTEKRTISQKRPIESAGRVPTDSQKKYKAAKIVSSESTLLRVCQAKASVKTPLSEPLTRPPFLPNRAINGPSTSEQSAPNISLDPTGDTVTETSLSRPRTMNLPRTHFRPLVPLQNSLHRQKSTQPSTTDQVSTATPAYLDFASTLSSSPPSSFHPITIPPTLAQRKHVNAWSVILSGLSDSERRICAFVSRDIRYAVYLSAIPIINRVFGTRRLAFLSGKHNTNMSMTNFWPYLKQLRQELTKRQMSYARSFLARFFGEHIPVADRIWGCPDNDKQLTVALRFLVTRVWFALSLNGNGIEEAKNSVVLDAQEVVKEEIWNITVLTRSMSRKKVILESFYVLESTCEVIGLSPPSRDPLSAAETSDHSTSTMSRTLCLRVDWAGYIQQRISSANESNGSPSLLNFLKTTNEEEYIKGISKIWLARVSKEGEVGDYKKKVAERYILACVMQNSVSGQWMTSAHMAQVFAGTALESDLALVPLLHKESRRVGLFLPAWVPSISSPHLRLLHSRPDTNISHHLVESVHFTTSGPKGQLLHPALAIIQTPSREYFILRDSGMEVGCEEDDGVWAIWTELLGCDSRGVARS